MNNPENITHTMSAMKNVQVDKIQIVFKKKYKGPTANFLIPKVNIISRMMTLIFHRSYAIIDNQAKETIRCQKYCRGPDFRRGGGEK